MRHVLDKLLKGSTLVVYVKSEVLPVKSYVDLVADDLYSAVGLSPSWLLVSGRDATTAIVAISF